MQAVVIAKCCACGRSNRVDTGRAKQARPLCGQCKAHLLRPGSVAAMAVGMAAGSLDSDAIRAFADTATAGPGQWR